MATPFGPRYMHCLDMRHRAYIICTFVLGVAALLGFAISVNYANGILIENNCSVGYDSGCVFYNGQAYQYTYEPGVFYAMIVLTFGPFALAIVASFLFWFFRPPPSL